MAFDLSVKSAAPAPLSLAAVLPLCSALVFATVPALAADPAAAIATAPARIPTLDDLLKEALKNNSEIRAALKEAQAAEYRVAPAGALDDPMLEAGVLNVPTDSFSFNREDMTMKMIGLSQKLPYAGKRDLRRQVAAKEAESVTQGHRETVNRVLRDVKLAYYNVALAAESERLTEKNRTVLGQTLKVVESRYAVGQATQADVLRARAQFTRMLEEIYKLGRERQMAESEVARLTGRDRRVDLPAAALPAAGESSRSLADLEQTALRQRPQLVALQTLLARGEHALDLARKETLPDFDLKFAYGQRDNAPDGMKRSDLVSFTVAMNLPVWRTTKNEPKIAEAQAMREKAADTLRAQRQEIRNELHHQLTTAEQNLQSVRLYERDILPTARLTLEAAFSAYRVNRVDFLTLLDSQMALLNYEVASTAALAAYHKANAEIEFLTGRLALDALGEAASKGEQP